MEDPETMRASATAAPITTTNIPRVTQIHKRLLFFAATVHLPRLEKRSRSLAEIPEIDERYPTIGRRNPAAVNRNVTAGMLVGVPGGLITHTQPGPARFHAHHRPDFRGSNAILTGEMHGLLLVECVVVAMLILANGFFVAAEFALVSIRDTRIQQMLADRVPGARAVRR